MTKRELMGSTAVEPHDDPIAADFRNFLYLVWKHLGLPDPTPMQYRIAYFLQNGWPDRDPHVGRRDILEAFRGIGKSFIVAAFVLWRLYRNPRDEKVLVVSATGSKAKEFVYQVRSILMTMDLLAHLRPVEGQRNQIDRFDVRGASQSQSPSVKAAGITGQITGSRATLIVADDIEIPENSKTEEGRETLMRTTYEFEAIIVPDTAEMQGDIIFLGTPQSYESIYTRKIAEQGYRCLCIPARYPQLKKRAEGAYMIKLKDVDGRETGEVIDILAPFIDDALRSDPSLEWKPTDTRFDERELLRREGKGRANFMLQYMLDTTMSDADRYPLRASDLIVTGVNTEKAPMTIQWGRDTNGKNLRSDIPNYGFSGDICLGPLFMDTEWRPYEGSVLFVDPSGRGGDETAWAVVKTLNGTLYCPLVAGHRGDPTEGMYAVARAAKRHNVNLILIEPNFAPGIWIAAFHPILAEVWPGNQKLISRRDGKEVIVGEGGGCTVKEAEWSKGQKELRIIDTLEPVMSSHRLVVDESVARDEVLMTQLTHISRERGSLKHDDRLDALAGAVAHFELTLRQDQQRQAEAMRAAELDQMVEEFLEDLQAPYRPWRRGVRNRRECREIEVYSS